MQTIENLQNQRKRSVYIVTISFVAFLITLFMTLYFKNIWLIFLPATCFVVIFNALDDYSTYGSKIRDCLAYDEFVKNINAGININLFPKGFEKEIRTLCALPQDDSIKTITLRYNDENKMYPFLVIAQTKSGYRSFNLSGESISPLIYKYII